MTLQLETTVRELLRIGNDLQSNHGIDPGEKIGMEVGSAIIIVRSARAGYISSYRFSGIPELGQEAAPVNDENGH